MDYWHDKEIKDCSKEELIECIEFLTSQRKSYSDYLTNISRIELEEVEAENKKLWDCLGRK